MTNKNTDLDKVETLQLSKHAPLKEFQSYIHRLEKMHGWLDVDLVHNCFLMGEEVGELFKAVRKYEKLFDEDKTEPQPKEKDDAVKQQAATDHVAEEIVDVMNYLLAIANRLDIDVEDAFRKKNALNQKRTWS